MQIPGPLHFVVAILSVCITPLQASDAQILSIRQAGDELVVEAQAPPGFKKLTLEGRADDRSWQPRSVRRTDGAEGRVTFSVQIVEHYELLRVRAEQEEKLAAKFFTGATVFQEYSTPPPPTDPLTGASNLTIADSGGGTVIFGPGPVEEPVLGPYSVDQIFAVDQYLVEVTRSGTNKSGVVRVALASTPHTEQTKLELQNGEIKAATVKDSKLYLLQAKSDYSVLWSGPARDQTVALTVIDLASLPALSILGEVRTNLSMPDLAYDIEALWPSEETLVFASVSRMGPQNIRVRSWEGNASSTSFRKRTLFNQFELQSPALPTVTMLPMIIFQPVTDVFVLPVLFPVVSFYSPWSSTPQFLAFDVTTVAQPKLASKVSLDPMVASATSEIYATNNLIYLSHTVTEQEITGSNSWVATVPRYSITTNVAPVTNVVSVPHQVVTTNEVIRTEIEATVTGTTLVTNLIPEFNVSRTVRSASGVTPALTSVRAGGRHGLSLSAEGQIEAWGNNSFDQLGTSLSTLPPITSIAAGELHSLALDDAGRVWGWGANQAAQIIPVVSDSPVPLPVRSQPAPTMIVRGLPFAAAIAAGLSHSLDLTDNGEVWAWGDNNHGQLGVGDVLPRTGPIRSLGLSNIIAISARSSHNFALDNDGRVFAWGDNTDGQLGAEGPILATPAPVATSLTIAAIAAGDNHALLLTASGTVFASGRNDRGALGNGTIESRNAFAPVPGLPVITQIAAGRDHSLAVDEEGGLWVWGRNDLGQADTVAGDDLLIPRKLHSLPGVTSISAGTAFSLALTDAGELWSWGDNRYGQLGNGVEHLTTNHFQVVEVLTVTNYVYSTNSFAEIVLSTNTVYAHQTNVVLRTNFVTLQYFAYETNWYNTYRNINKSFANVVDFNNSTSPVIRRPVSIPGKLVGLSHDGAVLYTTAAHSSTNGDFEGHWVDAVSYDGTAAYLIDGQRVDGFNTPLVQVADDRAFVLNETGTNIQVFQLSATPSFESVATIPIPQSHEMEIIGSSLVLKGTSLLLFDPETLALRGTATFPPSIYFPLKTVAPGPNGFWLTRGWQGPLEFTFQE